MANLTNTLKKFNRSSRAALAAVFLTLAASATWGATPAVLTEIPSDAKAVLVIANVKDLSTKISNLAVRLNLPAPPDLTGYLTRSIGITKGFDDSGSAALAILNSPQDAEAGGGGGPPQMILLLPTNDPKAMMEPFQPGDPDKKGISEVTLPGDRAEKGYVATVDKWLALAQDKSALEAYLARKNNFTKTLTPESTKVFDSNDVVLWADVPNLTKGFDKLLEDKQQELTGMLDLMNLDNKDPLASAIQKAAINEYFLAAKQYLKDASAAMITLRMTDNGPTLGLVGSFRPDSPFGKFVAAQKPAKPLDLTGLPNGEFFAAAAFQWDPKTVSDLFNDISKRVMSDEVIAKDPKAKDINNYLDILRQILPLTSGESFVLLETPGPAASKNGFFNGACLVDTSDPAKFYALQLELMKSPLLNDSMIPDIKQETKATPDAVTIKGVKLTKVHTTYTLREETPDKPLSPIAKRQYAMLQNFYGPEGLTFYTGPVGKHILVVLGSDAGILEASVNAAQANTAELNTNANITASKNQVVPNTVAVFYFNTGKFLTLAQNMAAPNTAAPINTGAPVVLSAGVNNATLTTELHIPTTTITTIKDAWTKLMPLLMGGARQPPAEGENNNGAMQP
jgi:hypothetical protein